MAKCISSPDEARIAVIGLGYVGLPLAVYMAQHFDVVGFDIDPNRVDELRRCIDRTREVTAEEFAAAKRVSYASDPAAIADSNFYIVAVPTPIDGHRRPDLSYLEKSSTTVGRVLSPGDIVVYESTVYPGATEELCVPILEETSGLKFNEDFFVGYSPERVNPGDHERRLPSIKKITSGSTPEAAAIVDGVYKRTITAGTHLTSSIRAAEAAKVIENVQRDLNIGLVNELAMLFKKLGIETREVLEAAGTKWNFQHYRPGLVGGHCIGVDPYYLTHKAQQIGFHPEIILAGRRVNDNMAAFLAHDIITTMVRRRMPVSSARLLIMGFTFKENCPDVRNTKVADLVRELEGLVASVDIYDPHASPAEAMHEYGTKIVDELPEGQFDGIVLAVRHNEFIDMGIDALRRKLADERGFIYDVKWLFTPEASDARL